MPNQMIEGQLIPVERQLLTDAILTPPSPPQILLEVGTWLGGGSTLHILRALHQRGAGHLWGIEADRSIYDRMLSNIRQAVPEAIDRFTPLFGFSQDVIPEWLAEQKSGTKIDFVFLDGGNRPGEQITEFDLLDPHIPVGGQLMAHDAKLRKGKWLMPYLSQLDHWKVTLHDVSDEGLLSARKTAEKPSPASRNAARRLLRKLQWQPVELAARWVPSSLRGRALQLLPKRFARRMSDGRK
jgi:predicted O-methyltransferase YrrM